MENKPDEPIDVGPEKEVGPEKAPPTAEITQEAKTWGMMAHLSALIAIALSAGTVSFVGPLIIYIAMKDNHPFIEDQAKEALNFQLTMFIAVVIAWGITGFTCGMGAPLLAIPIILQIVFGIIAMVKANSGEYYRYPMCIRMIS